VTWEARRVRRGRRHRDRPVGCGGIAPRWLECCGKASWPSCALPLCELAVIEAPPGLAGMWHRQQKGPNISQRTKSIPRARSFHCNDQQQDVSYGFMTATLPSLIVRHRDVYQSWAEQHDARRFGCDIRYPRHTATYSGHCLRLHIHDAGRDGRPRLGGAGLAVVDSDDAMGSAAWMLLLAWRIATADGFDMRSTGRHGHVLGFGGAAAFQWVNPSAWLVVTAAAGMFIRSGQSLWAQTAWISAVFFAVAIPCMLPWLLLGCEAGHFLRSAGWRRAFNGAMALLLVASIIPLLLD